MEWEISDYLSLVALIIAFVTLLISFLFALLNYIFTKRRTRIRGPEFVIPLIEMTEQWGTRNDGTNYCRIKPLIQNIGDRMSFIRIKTMLLQLTKDWDYTSKDVEGLPWEMAFQAQTQTPKAFVINVDKKAKGWRYGSLIIFGEYTNHLGEINHRYWFFHITEEKEMKLAISGNTDAIVRKTISKEKTKHGVSETTYYEEILKETQKIVDRRVAEVKELVLERDKKPKTDK